jgi:hypothetical protein
LKLKYLEIYQV